jgi:hypothetical protein
MGWGAEALHHVGMAFMKETPFPAASVHGGLRRGLRSGARVRPGHSRRKKSFTKAALKRGMRASLDAALSEIGTAGRIDMVSAKKAHLERAVAHLEALLRERPGAYLLRRQLVFCVEALREIDRGSPGARTIVVDAGSLKEFRI